MDCELNSLIFIYTKFFEIEIALHGFILFYNMQINNLYNYINNCTI